MADYELRLWCLEREVQVHLINRIQLGYQSECIYKRNHLGIFKSYSQLRLGRKLKVEVK